MSALYPLFKQKLLSQTDAIDFDTDTIRVIFTTAAYNSAHDFFNDLTGTIGDGGTGRANGEQLINPTLALGVLDADDTVFASVGAGSIIGAVLYKDTGADGTSPLIAYIDLTFTGNTGQVTIQWDSGASKIFAL
jgi:hypothetical protein